MYKLLIKPFLFLFNPESAHEIASTFMKLAGYFPFNLLIRMFFARPKAGKYSCMGIDFPSRVGLAAGFDKDGVMFKGLDTLGFGFIEVGTVTPKAQPGNDKPRIFRLVEDSALINRMGFNNRGVDHLVSRLKKRNKAIVIGGNIGKNKITPNDEAYKDYEYCFKKLHPYVDYFTVNVSSPNTPGLRELQDKEPLKKILLSLRKLNETEKNAKPILLKIAPDLSNEQLDEVVEIVQESNINGIIACNTTIDRSGLISSSSEVEAAGPGGLSGNPLKQRALDVVSYLKVKSNDSFVIIGVGGISSANDALNMLKAGADLVQVYSSFIYEGPALLKDINNAFLNYSKS